MKTVKIEIPSMQSSHCQMRVTHTLNQIESVLDVITLPGSAMIKLEDHVEVNNIITEIERIGYSVDNAEFESKVKCEQEDSQKSCCAIQ